MVTASAAVTVAAAGGEGGRTKVRPLYSFERPGEARELLADSEHVDISVVQDNCVTDGRNCARLVARRGVAWAYFNLGRERVRDWADFDYFAFDLYTEDAHPYSIVFELWDGRSRNYATRCTYENVTVHPGRQTLLYHIARAKRNNKEGRDWNELEPADKIDLNALRRVKMFLTPRKDRDAVFWIDNLRLMQEDAAKPKMSVSLPEGAVAFDFGSGGDAVPGFEAVSPESAFAGGNRFGFVTANGLESGGKGWPDLLAGTFVWSPSSRRMTFRARLPDGKYRAYLAAGKAIRSDLKSRRFLLRIGDTTFCDEEPSFEELCGEKYLYRFMGARYSERPHALWENYVARMYPAHELDVEVADGTVTVEAENHFLSALILVPAGRRDAFTEMTRAIRTARIEAFEKTYYTPRHEKPGRRAGDGPFLVYVPDPGADVQPWTGPSEEERARRRIIAAGTPGERVVMRLVVVPFEDLGAGRLEPSELVGPAGRIPSESIACYLEAYRSDGKGVSEMALVPSRHVPLEQGVTRAFWLRAEIPEDARPGTHRGTFAFRPGRGRAVRVPVEVEVHPFRLEADLPVAYGMYYQRRGHPALPAGRAREVEKARLEMMRRFGFTSVTVGAPRVTGVDRRNRKVSLRFDRTMYDLAREVGMGTRPEQALMASGLPIGRAIGRRLPGSIGAKVDQNPGIELRQPGFREMFLDAARQFSRFIESTGMPVAVEIVDEPREMPNPWNRNLADTIAYAGMLREAGLRTFVTPMGDANAGKDYTILADHADIISVHAWKASKGLMERTRGNGRTLWIYNTGRDRFSWGFYNWRAGSHGRWEWHFSWPEDRAEGGYPGREWYNPFTGLHGLAPNAPHRSYPGGMLFQSCFLEIAEGITDYAYLYTLERRLDECEREGRGATALGEARRFLADVRRAIPEFPDVKGLAGEADGALVGAGINVPARRRATEWRRQAAGLLKRLSR